uniref:Putative zinc transporter ZIP domain-containing protein n=1 Tax=Schistosoma mansoni TaxID=6183 RepID=A0A3Q0KRL9_SCHMA
MLYLIFLNILLFVGCYIAGCIPISFRIPVSKIRILTVFGAGLLLGAALVVVIPEGIAVICSSHKHQHSNLISNKDNHLNLPNSRRLNMADTVELTNDKNLPLSINKDNDPMKQPNNIDHDHTHNDDNDNSSSSYIHQKVGIALLLGYLFMLLVDQMSYTILELTCCQTMLFGLKKLCYRSILYIPLMNRLNNDTGTIVNTTNTTSSNNMNCTSNPSNLVNETLNSNGGSSIGSIQSTNHKGLIVTCGLVIHSLADGLAIGSAFALNQLQLELILFLAIILHKIPAAFGLSCFLLHEGLTRDRIRLHMIAFSLSSPLASFFTYFYLSLSSTSSTDTDISEASTRTGLALLLSGGTFLYVAATHILPELINSSNTDSSTMDLNTVNDTTNSNLYLFTDSLNNKPGHHHHVSTSSSSSAAAVASPLSNYALYTVDNSHESIIMYNYPKSNLYLNSISHIHRLSIIEVFVLISGTIIPILFSTNHSH